MYDHFGTLCSKGLSSHKLSTSLSQAETQKKQVKELQIIPVVNKIWSYKQNSSFGMFMYVRILHDHSQFWSTYYHNKIKKKEKII